MRFDPEKPFNDLRPLPPKVDIESKAILRKTVTAGRALAELKGLGDTIPNRSILVNFIVLNEARASSEIENIITSNDALFQAITANKNDIDPETKEVLRYREALWEGYNQLTKRKVLSTNLFIKIVQIIKKNQAGIRNTPGTKISNIATQEIIYTPPEGESIIRDKLKHLEDFIHNDNRIDPLVKLPLIHYQFEAIHPFSDGNGRAGRIINILFLNLVGLLDLPVLYLSKSIIDRKNDYYRLLRQVTEEGKWEPWILFMLDAVESSATMTRERIIAIRDLIIQTMDTARNELPKRVFSKELIELIFNQPYTKVEFVVSANIAKRQTAGEYLKELERIGVLKSRKIGKETLYLNQKLFELLSR